MAVPAYQVLEEIRQQEQRLRQIEIDRVRSGASPDDETKPFSLVGRQRTRRITDRDLRVAHLDTELWLDELRGAVLRSTDPMSDNAAASVRYTLAFVRGQVDAIAHGRLW